MQKDLGSVLALYPMPVVIVGAMNGEVPTWTMAAHVGILGHDRILVSLAKAHFINKAILADGKLSLNLVNEGLLPDAAKSGFVSANKESKADLFAWHSVEGVPVISEAPIAMTGIVMDNYETPGFDNFIFKIDHTLVDEACINEAGKIDFVKAAPVLFDFPNYEFLKTGESLGSCVSWNK